MHKNPPIAFLILIAFIGFLPSPALSHGGGTDSNGCHKDSKTGIRHCHTPKFDTPSVSYSSNESVSSLPPVVSLPEDCKEEFGFSRLLNQAATGYIRAHCGKSFLSIQAH